MAEKTIDDWAVGDRVIVTGGLRGAVASMRPVDAFVYVHLDRNGATCVYLPTEIDYEPIIDQLVRLAP